MSDNLHGDQCLTSVRVMKNITSANETINIVLAFDDNYVFQAMVVIASIILNNKKGNFKFYLIGQGISKNKITRLEGFVSKFNLLVEIQNINNDLFDQLSQYCHVSRSAYIRLILDDLIKEDRVLYLDCDLIVECDLQELWSINIGDHALAAVPEREALQAALQAHVGMREGLYVNSGVCLINLNVWRELKLSRQCFSWIENNRPSMMDQDAINAVVSPRIYFLPGAYNINPIHQQPEIFLKDYPERVIHFAGPLKPWHQWYDFYLRDRFWFYAEVAGVQHDIVDREPQSIGQSLSVMNQNCALRNFEQAAKGYNTIINKSCLNSLSAPQKSRLEVAVDFYNQGNFMKSCSILRTLLQEKDFVVDHRDVYLYPNIQDGLY
jgi:lipopolysaccharide biosynthesis glycosyltransferase